MTNTSANESPGWMASAHDRFLSPERVAKNSTTFVDNMKLPVHRWYRYSAGYSAQWATDLIRHWGSRRVLDPFGGSGTTLLAAQEIGVESQGAEVHPTVARIAKAKLGWQADPDEYRHAIDTIMKRAKNDRPVNVPRAPLVEKCYPDVEALHDLLRIRDAMLAFDASDERIKDLVWLTFVTIIRPTSPAGTAQWQYVLPNKTKSRVAEPFDAFSRAADLIADDMEARKFIVGSDAVSATLHNVDARDLGGIEDGWADAVITSPPYANNYDYADALRLEQIMLGDIDGWRDLKELRQSLVKSATQNIGGWDSAEALNSVELKPIHDQLLPVYEELSEVRKTRGGKKNYHAMLAGYFYDNARVFLALRRVASEGARVCYVVGDSAPYGVHAPVEKWLGELAVSAGFKSWSFSKVRDRNTKWRNRKHTHPLHEGYLWIQG